MFRVLVLAAVGAALLAAPVAAKRIARPFSAVEKVAHADATVVGKVTAIEKELVVAAPVAGAAEKLSYQIAVMKVDAALTGDANATHVKVGFVAQPKGEPAPGRLGRGGFGPVTLTESSEGLFYLTKHHSGAFYTLNPMLAPAETKADDYKEQLAQAKRAAAALADPIKALKADKAADRAFAATVLVLKYRSYPLDGGEVGTTKVPADESRTILKALAEGEWKPDPNDATGFGPFQAFGQLGLTDKDGWKPPVLKAGDNYIDKTKEAFVAWLDGPGKEYQIAKFVRK